MVVAVVADLVHAAARDLAAGVGVVFCDLRRHRERGRDAVPVEQGEDPWQPGADVVVAAGERAGRRQPERPAPEGLGVEERGGAAVAALRRFYSTGSG